jgi:hypothetical protein
VSSYRHEGGERREIVVLFCRRGSRFRKLQSCKRSFGLSELGLSRLIPTYFFSHNTIHSTSRALFIESAEQTQSLDGDGDGDQSPSLNRENTATFIQQHRKSDGGGIRSAKPLPLLGPECIFHIYLGALCNLSGATSVFRILPECTCVCVSLYGIVFNTGMFAKKTDVLALRRLHGRKRPTPAQSSDSQISCQMKS